MNEQARRSSPPNRVRSPTDQQFTSGCSPPRLAATQLPSATEFVAYSDTDFHRADIAPSRAHSFPHAFSGGSTRLATLSLSKWNPGRMFGLDLRKKFRGYGRGIDSIRLALATCCRMVCIIKASTPEPEGSLPDRSGIARRGFPQWAGR
jgi:hypothetical protein